MLIQKEHVGGGIAGMVRIAEVRAAGEAVDARYPRGVLSGEQGLQLVERPQIVLPFAVIDLGILGGEERALRGGHLAQHVFADAASGACKQRSIWPGKFPRGSGVGLGERAVVVEHLLKVRHEPLVIHAVAVESAADLVEHAAEGHARERCVQRTLEGGSGSVVARGAPDGEKQV